MKTNGTATNLTLVGASAGSGKTHRLTHEVIDATTRAEGAIDLEGLLAVTYTRKAAAELTTRIRTALVKQGDYTRAQRVPLARLGTVHGVCLRLVQEFAIDAGLSPNVDVMPPGSDARLLRQALELGVDHELRARIDQLAYRLQIRFDGVRSRCDWLSPVQDIMTLARSNRIEPAALASMAERSANGLVELLGLPMKDGDAMDRDLRDALEKTSRALSKVDDATGTTNDARAVVAEALRTTKNSPDSLKWSEWVRLSKLKTGRAARTAVEDLQAIAAQVDTHPRLHAEIRELTLAMFEAARQGLAAYDTWKKKRRVVDFVDMIDRALTLLETSEVADEVKTQLRLLVVDEFQDTSPVQLALFVRLHGLVHRSTWVGDRKQCIFEFAGADPALMESMTAWVAASGGTSEQLTSNWRSRPELVEACSQLFATAFARHGYRGDEVTVSAERPAPPGLATLPPFGFWALDVKKNADEAEAIAEGVRRLLEAPSATPVVDPATQAVRDLRAGDIAILVATNKAAEEVAHALATRGMRATVARAGLLATPEATLLHAAICALLDPRDDLSRATMDALTGFDGNDPDAWLSARLAYIATRHAAKAAGETPAERTSSPVVARVERLTRDLEGASPTETVDALLAALDLVTIACRWPDPEQRLANLDALRAMAAAYEERCKHEREAATIAGLLRYFDEAAQLTVGRDEERASDEQHVGAGDGAVTVLTYHRAKGLEWPIVILASLDKGDRRSAFEVAPETDRPTFDPSEPLAGRWIRYWPWPYGQQRACKLAEIAEASAVGKAVAEREERERVRLLYVGFTRARDHLILAARVGAKGPAVEWLDELCDEDRKPLIELPVADGTRSSLSIRDGKRSREHPARVWKLGTGDEPVVRLPTPEDTSWFARPDVAPGDRPAYRIAPSRAAVEWTDVRVPAIRGSRSIGERLPLGQSKNVEWNVVGDALHAFLASDLPELSRAQRIARAERLLVASDLIALLGPDALLRAGDQLRAWAASEWPGATWHREYPVSAAVVTEHGTRRVSGAIDLVLMTKDGAVTVDHKSFPGASSGWSAKAEEYAPQMGAYVHVLKAAGVSVVGQYVHFSVGAGVVELV